MVYMELESTVENQMLPKIVTVGVGGGGSNAVNHMARSRLGGVNFIVANTDMQVLAISDVQNQIQLGGKKTAGLGAGQRPEVGFEAAQESKTLIQEAMGEPNLVFISAGMGGGTGTGAAPVIAEIARDLNALTVGVVTKPFPFEGKKRARIAEEGIEKLREQVHSLIVIPNERLIQQAPKGATYIDMLKRADDVLYLAVKGIVELLTKPGLINLDFNDLKTVMGGDSGGMAMIGTGVGLGETRARDAANLAIHSPLLEDGTIDGASGVLLNITAGKDVGIKEIDEASSIIQAAAHPDADFIFGTAIAEGEDEEFHVTVVATGIERAGAKLLRNPSAKVAVFEQDRRPGPIPTPLDLMLQNRPGQAMEGQNKAAGNGEAFSFHRGPVEVPFFLQK